MVNEESVAKTDRDMHVLEYRPERRKGRRKHRYYSHASCKLRFYSTLWIERLKKIIFVGKGPKFSRLEWDWG